MKKHIILGLAFVFFSALVVQAQDVDVPGNLTMVDSTPTTGNILKGGVPFIHNFGSANTFIGKNAGNFAMTGDNNTASGDSALSSNTSGNGNAASGSGALHSNTTGSYNTACGSLALYGNTEGSFNTVTGGAMGSNLTGNYNTASGVNALYGNTTGSFNTGSGFNALLYNVTGSYNTALGIGAGVVFGMGDLTNTTAIGAGAVVDASNKIRLGDAGVTVIEGQVPYTFISDKNQKENFQPVEGEQVLSKIRGLKLTSWNYIGHDPTQFRHYGPVAQEFFGAFGHDAVGTIGNSTTINSGDMEGILMVAVHALEKRTGEFRQENEALKAENAELKSRLEAIERKLSGNANHTSH
jgi:hypothetical protein